MAKKIDAFSQVTETSEFQCPICLGIVVKATQSPCGHTFCQICIHQYLRKPNSCPVCRANIDVTHCKANAEFDARVRSTRISCEACNKQIRLSKYDKHESSCPAHKDKFKLLKEESISKIQPHDESKNRSTFPCPYCPTANLTNVDLIEHVQVSHNGDNTSVVCPICAVQPWGNPGQVCYSVGLL